MNYYQFENIGSSQQFFNKSTTIGCITGDLIDDRFKDYFVYSSAIQKGDIHIISESEVTFNIFDTLPDNSLTSYQLVTVVDKENISSLLIRSENGFFGVIMQFSFYLNNIFDTADYDFKNEIDMVLEPFVNDIYTNDFIADIKANGLMLLLKQNPDCQNVFSELLANKVRFDFFDY